MHFVGSQHLIHGEKFMRLGMGLAIWLTLCVFVVAQEKPLASSLREREASAIFARPNTVASAEAHN